MEKSNPPASALPGQTETTKKKVSFVDIVKTNSTPEITGQEYLLGVRGLLVIQSFLYTFLLVFAPNTVKDATITVDGPFWQIIFRKTLSVLFWNGTLIYTFFIILSARTLPVPFFTNPVKSVIAGSIFRRGIRLAVPVAVSLAIITAAFCTLGVSYIDDFKTATNNAAIDTPYILDTPLKYFNSVFQLFWITHEFFTQSGNFAYPGSNLWAINLIYQQSYTVFMIMVIAPYTRSAWRVKMSIPFLITAWWVQSWSWFSVTGLLLADMVMHMEFKAKAQKGISIRGIKGFRLPVWIPATIMMAAGLTLQFLWTSWRPDMLNDEIQVHSGLDYAGELNVAAPRQPQARDDNWLFVSGFLILLESYDWMQRLFDNPFFVYLGRRSLSWFLTQSWIIYIVGIKLFMHLTQGTGASTDAANVACLIITLITTVVTSEVFYRLIDHPSDALTKKLFAWMCT